MCVCVYVQMDVLVCIKVSMYVGICERTCVYECECVFVYVCVFMCARACVCVCEITWSLASVGLFLYDIRKERLPTFNTWKLTSIVHHPDEFID